MRKSTHPKKSAHAHTLDLAAKAKAKPTTHEFAPVRSQRKAQSIHGISASHAHAPAVKTTKHRSARAVATPKSPRISKFHKPAHTPMSPHRSYAVNQAAPTHSEQPSPAPSSYIRHTPTHHHQPSKPKRKGVVARFRRSLSKRPRLATGMAVGVSAVVLAGYITYLNLPNLKVRYAASQAGVDVQVPRYTPSGYSFVGPVSHGSGLVTIQFNSNSDNGFFTLTQSNTNWDSSSLLANQVGPRSNNQYQTFEENGLTIYTYSNGSNASWVNSGSLFELQSNAKLNPEQILKIASSL